MGVDFNMVLVRPGTNENIERVDEKTPFFSRGWRILNKLFDTNQNDNIQVILPKNVSFNWYDNAYSGYSKKGSSKPTLKNCSQPEEVLDCIETISLAIKIHDNELPSFFWLKKKKNAPTAESSTQIYIDGRSFYVKGGWENCFAKWSKVEKDLSIEKGDIEIDLTNKKEFKCHDSVYIEV